LAQLVGGVPEAFFERGVVGVFFRWGDPDHGFFLGEPCAQKRFKPLP